MAADPYTLVIAPNEQREASGTLFLDSGDGYAYRDGEHQYMSYRYAAGSLTASRISGGAFNASNLLERVEILGVSAVTRVVLRGPAGETELGFQLLSESNRLVIRKPAVRMAADDWTIVIN